MYTRLKRINKMLMETITTDDNLLTTFALQIGRDVAGETFSLLQIVLHHLI